MNNEKAIYKKETITTNASTGEIISSEEVVVRKVDHSPFIKFYPKNFRLMAQISGGYEHTIFCWILEHMEYGTNMIAINKTGMQGIVKYVFFANGKHIKKQSIKTCIKKLRDKEILLNIGRGSYIVNPNLCFKGSEKEKRLLKKEYDI